MTLKKCFNPLRSIADGIYTVLCAKNIYVYLVKSGRGVPPVRGPDKMAASTTTPKGKYTESLTFSTPNCIYANYGKLGKPSLHPLLDLYFIRDALGSPHSKWPLGSGALCESIQFLLNQA